MLRGMEGERLKMASEQRTDYGIAVEGSIGIPGLPKLRPIQAAMGSPVIARECCRDYVGCTWRGSVREGRANRSGNTVRFRLLDIFNNISRRRFFYG